MTQRTGEATAQTHRPCFLGTPPSNAQTTVTAADAPFPQEHRETLTRTGERLHLAWIPETSPARYVTGNSALNLHHPTLGEAGDWHQAGWWSLVSHTDPGVHYADINDDALSRAVAADFITTLGEAELADARPALADLRHPAAKRTRPVWCATHVRAVLELAWWNMRLDEEDDPGATLSALDPTSVARWLGSRDQWMRLHDLGDRIARVSAPQYGLEHAWRDWLSRQTPLAHYTTPNERWDLARLDQLDAEEDSSA